MAGINEGEERTIVYTRSMWNIISSIGWYVVAIAISLKYFSPYIRDKYENWKRKKEEQDYTSKYSKDLLQDRVSALEASRQKMQEDYRRSIASARKEERKNGRRNTSRRINPDPMPGTSKHEVDVHYCTTTQSKSTRGEYHPLMGDSSRGYRPPKRSCSGKGGCG